MKSFDKIFLLMAAVLLSVAVLFNLIFPKSIGSKEYLVDVNRVEQEIKNGKDVSAEAYHYITAVIPFADEKDFYDSRSEYVIRQINGKLYRIEYTNNDKISVRKMRLLMNVAMIVFFLLIMMVMLYIRRNIIKPFRTISSFPLELAKGGLTKPLEEQKSRYFGKFIWGLDMLRETLEKSNSREITRAKDEKTLLLSLSHDIKTPLAGIKLNAKALSKGIYEDRERQIEASESINAHADEIEKYVSEMISRLSDDFMEFEINSHDFYLDDCISSINSYYTERLKKLGTKFVVNEHTNCILNGDPDRLTEVLQNIMENAVKYGDGSEITISFSDEEDCRLITVGNTGCSLPDNELPNIFNSFWRGSNAGSKQGSGLGLFICRRLMHGMGGDIFADIRDEHMYITVVCRKE